MSRVLVTGARGFIGQALVRRLLRHGLDGHAVRSLTLADLAFDDGTPRDARVRRAGGSLADPAVRARALAGGVDAVFHLASVPGGATERDPAAARRVNLDATLDLLEDCQRQGGAPRFVYASSIAVHGEPLPATMDEATPPAPALSYGAHKLAGEIMVADASRRGAVQGCSLRLPGVVARPGDGAGLMSAFMSQLFWRLAAGQPVTVPVPADGTCWWISVGACVDNLLHAAQVAPDRLPPSRCHQMPVLHLSVGQVAGALAAHLGLDPARLVRYAPDPLVERLFARYPPLATPLAERAGFRHDGDVAALVRRALAPE